MTRQTTNAAALVEALASGIDRLNDRIGHAVAWLTALMVAVTFVVVVLRYFFDAGWIWLQEIIVWMHAMVFLLGAAYTLKAEEHVRVDVFYRRLGERGRDWIDLVGIVTLLLPFCGFLVWTALGYAADSWTRHEASREAGGLPYPFVPLLKSAIVAMAILLALQGLAQLLRAALRLAAPDSGAPDPAPGAGDQPP